MSDLGSTSGRPPCRVRLPPSHHRSDETAVELSPGARYDAPTALFFGLGFVAFGAAVIALVLERPIVAAIAAPSLVLLAVGLIEGRYPTVSVSAELDTPRGLEGDLTRLFVSVTSQERAIVELETGPMTAFDPVGSQRHVIVADRGERSVTFLMVPRTWGVLTLPSITVRARSRTGLFAATTSHRPVTPLRVHIHEEPARSRLEPLAFRRVVGSHLSDERAEGCEIADTRPYQPGDRLRTINWRISARASEPWVTLRHPDRSTTVVLVLDAYGTFGEGDRDTLRRSVRAAMGLARLHLDAQDPVGILAVGHGRRWIEPQLGLGHLATMTDALLELSTRDWGDRRHHRTPLDRLVPIDSVVIAISPLLNDAFGQLLRPLLARGQQVDVVEPVYALPPSISVRARDDNGDPALAWRVFELEQQLRRRALRSMGATVSPWSGDDPIESTLVAMRRAQRARLATGGRPGP